MHRSVSRSLEKSVSAFFCFSWWSQSLGNPRKPCHVTQSPPVVVLTSRLLFQGYLKTLFAHISEISDEKGVKADTLEDARFTCLRKSTD